jgi:hypothetical protein
LAWEVNLEGVVPANKENAMECNPTTQDYLNVRMKKRNTNLFGSTIDIFLREILLLDQVHLP